MELINNLNKMKIKKLSALIIVMSIMISNVAIAGPPIDPFQVTNPLYVDPISGDDAANDGLFPDRPVRTITKAIELANNSAYSELSILLKEGEYNAETYPLTISGKDISIYGGYNDDYSENDPDTYETLLQGNRRR